MSKAEQMIPDRFVFKSLNVFVNYYGTLGFERRSSG